MPLSAFRRVYSALHRWAEAGWAGPAVGTWNLLQGSVVPGPSDGLLVPLAVADPPRAFELAVWATAGAVLGGIAIFLVGATAYDSVGLRVLDWVGVSRAAVEARRALFVEHGWLMVVLSSVTPLPTKIVCLAAGAFGVGPIPFVVALLLGRGARFFAVAGACLVVGRRVERKAREAAAAEEAAAGAIIDDAAAP